MFLFLFLFLFLISFCSDYRFLRNRHKYLLKAQSHQCEPEFVQRKNSDGCSYNVDEAVPKHQSPVLDMKPISVIIGTVLDRQIISYLLHMSFMCVL